MSRQRVSRRVRSYSSQSFYVRFRSHFYHNYVQWLVFYIILEAGDDGYICRLGKKEMWRREVWQRKAGIAPQFVVPTSSITEFLATAMCVLSTDRCLLGLNVPLNLDISPTSLRERLKHKGTVNGQENFISLNSCTIVIKNFCYGKMPIILIFII